MAVNLYANNGELLRAAYTAMDQTYGDVAVGEALHSIDNARSEETPAREQPFATPEGYEVKAVVDDAGGFGGKFVIYKNSTDGTVLVTAMGTNGWSDAQGWYANVTSYGIDQWRASGARNRVFEEIAGVVDPNSKIVFSGDSKGGMLAQVMVYDLVTRRNEGAFADPSLGILSKEPLNKVQTL